MPEVRSEFFFSRFAVAEFWQMMIHKLGSLSTLGTKSQLFLNLSEWVRAKSHIAVTSSRSDWSIRRFPGSVVNPFLYVTEPSHTSLLSCIDSPPIALAVWAEYGTILSINPSKN